jgi:hypothetical protein
LKSSKGGRKRAFEHGFRSLERKIYGRKAWEKKLGDGESGSGADALGGGGGRSLGFEHDEALILGRAVAGLNAYSKGVSLGLFQPTPREVKEQRQKMRKEETVTVDLLHRAVPAKHIDEGLRALSGESPIHPESVQKYLESKFGDALEDVTDAMLELAKSLPSSKLAEKAYDLYEKFRSEIPPGKKGWGASGKLDLDLIRKMASA